MRVRIATVLGWQDHVARCGGEALVYGLRVDAMGELKEIRQKLGPFRTRYAFEADRVRYELRDADGSIELLIDYELFPSETTNRSLRSTWFRHAFWWWLGIGAFLLLGEVRKGVPPVWGSFLLCAAAVAGVVYVRRRCEYSVFRTEAGSPFVLRDERHDEVIEEIQSRRKELLRRRYAYLDPDADAARERARIRWLVSEGALSDEEASLILAHGGKPGDSSHLN